VAMPAEHADVAEGGRRRRQSGLFPQGLDVNYVGVGLEVFVVHQEAAGGEGRARRAATGGAGAGSCRVEEESGRRVGGEDAGRDEKAATGRRCASPAAAALASQSQP